MIYDDLQRLVGYGLTIIEFYNEDKELEYIANLDDLEFEDVDIILSQEHSPVGIIKLYRYDKESEYDGKSV
jgi:hypothetical protein|tara:strand:+ start:43 stop:255 length:213 start_codon:yes stop_codon:yes gene_type:complete